LKKVNKFRIAVVTAAVATGAALVEFYPGPIEAAQQSAAQVETAPKADTQTAGNAGAESYAKHCAVCHGEQREGNLPGFPPLLGINRRMPDNKIAELIHTGKGRMPGFPNVQGGELTALVHYLTNADGPPQAAADGAKTDEASGLAETGGALFHQNCAFCHGRDAMGGESGPNLTQSNLVLADTTGEKIAAVVREGRPDNKMPGFNFSSQEMRSLIAFIHARETEAKAHPGGRRGVSIEDLQTGNAEAGKRYFEGPGGCTKCHSTAGDLAGLANRHKGLQLERRMLYPEDARSTVIVTLPSGEKISGTLAYRDEFTVALRDSNGIYRSWPASQVGYVVKSPADAHVELFDKYTDDDIHNLMAYLQTLR
jgi:mono/diheme cytochrome c family protein